MENLKIRFYTYHCFFNRINKFEKEEGGEGGEHDVIHNEYETVQNIVNWGKDIQITQASN